MNISNISGNSAVLDTTSMSSQSAQRPSSIPPAAPPAASSSKISERAQLFSLLQQLAQKDPVKFKEITQNLADQLHEAAKQTSGKAADAANALADKFTAAAQSGNMSSFQPPASDSTQAAHHHHHHHHGERGAALSSILTSAIDQANQALNPPATTPAA